MPLLEQTQWQTWAHLLRQTQYTVNKQSRFPPECGVSASVVRFVQNTSSISPRPCARLQSYQNGTSNEDRGSEIRRDINPLNMLSSTARVIAQADYNNSVMLLNAMRRVFTAKSCILATFFDGFHAAPCPELSRPPVGSGPCRDGTCSVRCRQPRAFSLHSSKDRSGSTRGMGTDFKVRIERQFGGIEGPVLNKIATSHRVCRGIVPAEPFDECKDVIGGLPPSERFGIDVVSINKRSDVCPEGGDARRA